VIDPLANWMGVSFPDPIRSESNGTPLFVWRARCKIETICLGRNSITKIVKRTILWDSLLLFLLASALIWPLYRLKYLDNWPSLKAHLSGWPHAAENLPHPGWQPLWYCGTRFDYI